MWEPRRKTIHIYLRNAFFPGILIREATKTVIFIMAVTLRERGGGGVKGQPLRIRKIFVVTFFYFVAINK